jgi:nucleoside 2-deoxyribosyltransferase
MKLYLAGPLSAAHDIRFMAARLQGAGHTLTSRWLSRPPSNDYSRLAAEDLADIDACDCLILWTSQAKHFGGARHTEAGYALGRGKRIVVFGPRENLFYTLPGVAQAYTVRGLLDVLAKGPDHPGPRPAKQPELHAG